MAMSDRGFGTIKKDPERMRAIASKGGKAAHKKGVAHEWTKETARKAGRKGGISSARRAKERAEREA